MALTMNPRRLRALWALALAALPACGGGGDQSGLIPTPPLMTFRILNSWVCPDATNCQDVYDVVLDAPSDLTITVTKVTGPSVLRLAVYEPGMPLGGTNLLTNTTNERMCSLANSSDSITITISEPGTYRVAVGRDWGASSGANGSYALEVKSDHVLNPIGQTVDDQPTLASASQCP
jgi:hypothetical protein